jgi:glycosyltransferase involved in cell wall biosynthesis
VKVLLVSHTCLSRTAGQPKLHALAAFPDIELTALVPDRMRFYGRWEDADPIENPSFRYVIGRARWQEIGGQWYLQHYPDALARLLRETQPDIVDLWHEPWSLVAAQGVWLTRRLCPQAKIVVETEQNIYKRLPPPFRQFQNYVLRHADYAVARNQEAIVVLRRKGYDGPARVVPNAVDCDLFRPFSPEERRICRERLAWAGPETFLIGCVGRLVSEKGLTDALSALAQMSADAHLLLAGEGPMRSDLEAQAAVSGLTGRVHFAGSRPLTELPEIMNVLDALLLPSRTTSRWKEQFGRVLIEAGACGVAVIGSDSGAIPEVIGDAGLTYPEGDVAALADRLRCLQEDAALRARLGRTGRERAVRLFSWPQVAAQMRAIYGEMLEKN